MNNPHEYKSVFLSKEDYKGSKLEKWIKTCTDSGGYYQFINSDPDSWDMYIYYPDINPELKYKIDLKLIDTVLKVYLNTENSISDKQIAEDLVLEIKTPFRGAWPSRSELYVNENKINCIGREDQD